MPTWPDPDAPRSAVDDFVRTNTPALTHEHEAPAPESGPAIVCNGCGIVRIATNAPHGMCRACRACLGEP